MDINELYLKTAFCCMACDGEIADEEVALLKKTVSDETVFNGLDVQEKINEYVEAINSQGSKFLNDFVLEVKGAELDDDSSLRLIKIAIDTIECDNEIRYAEVSFFKRIRRSLPISDESILEVMPDKEDYLLPDVEDDFMFDIPISFDLITVSSFN